MMPEVDPVYSVEDFFDNIAKLVKFIFSNSFSIKYSCSFTGKAIISLTIPTPQIAQKLYNKTTYINIFIIL